MDAKPIPTDWQDDAGEEPEADLFDTIDEAAEEAADLRAEEDFAAGRFVPHDQVMAWVRTWGTPDEKPMPPEWLK